MVKIAELINGKIICGETEDGETWEFLFFVQLMPTSRGQVTINFMPVANFGDFDEKIKIEKSHIVYSYEAESNFAQNYQQQIINYKAQISGIIIAKASDIKS